MNSYIITTITVIMMLADVNPDLILFNNVSAPITITNNLINIPLNLNESLGYWLGVLGFTRDVSRSKSLTNNVMMKNFILDCQERLKVGNDSEIIKHFYMGISKTEEEKSFVKCVFAKFGNIQYYSEAT